MIWMLYWPGMLVIPAVVTALVLIVHGPQVRRNMRRMAAERRALEQAADARQADQPKKTSASA